MQKFDADCKVKIADLVQMKVDDNPAQQERLMQERERLLVALNPVEAGLPINPRPMAGGGAIPLRKREQVAPAP